MKFSTYRNLQNGRYMLRAVGGPMDGKVIGSAIAVVMVNASLIVAPLEAAKVKETGRRSKHAFAVGHVTRLEGFKPFKRHAYSFPAQQLAASNKERPYGRPNGRDWVPLRYNPFRDATFMGGGLPINMASLIYLHKHDGTWASGIAWSSHQDHAERTAA